MTAGSDREAYVLALDEELLRGGVMLSEWSTFLVRSADVAYCAYADLAAIFAAQAAMEAHLRYEYFRECERRMGFAKLISEAPIPEDLATRLHGIRRYRNRWTHVDRPERDEDLLANPTRHEAELSRRASDAMRLLREVVYLERSV